MRYEKLAKNLKVLGLSSIVISVVVSIVIVVSGVTNESAALGLLVGAGILMSGTFFGLVEISLGSIIELLEVQRTNSEKSEDTKG